MIFATILNEAPVQSLQCSKPLSNCIFEALFRFLFKPSSSWLVSIFCCVCRDFSLSGAGQLTSTTYFQFYMFDVGLVMTQASV